MATTNLGKWLNSKIYKKTENTLKQNAMKVAIKGALIGTGLGGTTGITLSIIQGLQGIPDAWALLPLGTMSTALFGAAGLGLASNPLYVIYNLAKLIIETFFKSKPNK